MLHQNGFGNAVGLEIFFSFFIGLLIAIMTFRKRTDFQPKALYITTLIASAGLVFVPIAVFSMAFIAVMFFGATV